MIEFLYDNIIPCWDENKEEKNSIIKDLLEFIENSSFRINSIIQYCCIQSMNLQIKLIEFTIINNLLLLLNNEFNINLLLYLISKQNVRSNNSLISIFDKTDGADYFIKEKLYGQFNSFLKILSEKLIKNRNNYSEITKIYLIEKLIWKYKKRNFPIFIDIIKVFKEIKIQKYNSDNNNIYNITYFNKEKQLEYKFEMFKIFVY